jgi:quercetin 2,3-dioxygenase
MTNIRPIIKTITGFAVTDGAGVRLTRVIGHEDVRALDPFLMLDAFDSTNPDDYVRGFPWHPHRGIETITYLIEGDIEHADSLGNKGSIKDGDCQWMTAGSGIIHQEMPVASARMLGAQIWLNLPAAQKMVPPTYGDIRHEDVPTVTHDGARVKVLAGEFEGVKGAFTGAYVPATYLDIELERDASLTIPVAPGLTAFAYLFEGTGIFGEPGESVDGKHAVVFGDGDTVVVRAGGNGVRFILLFASPLREPIAWGGPIVMNTQAELTLAFRELDEGTFIRKEISQL